MLERLAEATVVGQALQDAVDEGESKQQFDDEIEVVNEQPKKRERRAPRRKDNNLAIEEL